MVALKRDLTVLVLGLCVILISGLFAAEQIVPAFSVSSDPPFTLVLDAGHGGEDGGASTASGQKESDINLSIVLRLESLMSFLGVETVLTRSEDASIHSPGCTTLREKKVSDLKNRVELVNQIPNAALISVHQNHFTDSRYRGAQVFYSVGDLSRQWGLCTQDLITTFLDPENTRKSAGIPEHVYLFSHTSCPAILVECGFLSNGEEASLLLTAQYQRKLAVTLASSYMQFIQMIPTPLGGN